MTYNSKEYSNVFLGIILTILYMQSSYSFGGGGGRILPNRSFFVHENSSFQTIDFFLLSYSFNYFVCIFNIYIDIIYLFTIL